MNLELGTAGSNKRRSVGRDGRLNTLGSEVGVVDNVHGGVNVPRDGRVLLGTFNQIRGEKGPRHGLGNSGFKPDGHGEGTGQLPKDHLLTSFSGDGLQKQLSSRSGIQRRQETVDAGFSPSGEDLERGNTTVARSTTASGNDLTPFFATYSTELNKLLDSLEIVPVLALLGTLAFKHVGDQSRVSDLLVGHELDQVPLLSVDTLSVEFFIAETRETIVEQVELDPF